jgi:hypothetical protein
MAQSCSNYGLANGSACACPPGFGGSDCSLPTCGGNIFQGPSRSLVPAPSTPKTFPNLTASACSCEGGWTGTTCNVCQTAQACQAGFASVNSSSGASLGLSSGQNNTLTCNTASRVYAAGHMSCNVEVRSCPVTRLSYLLLTNVCRTPPSNHSIRLIPP